MSNNKNAFTLIEVLVSVLLVVMMGLTLVKISSQNINTLQTVKEDYTYLYSSALNSIHDYKEIDDFITISDIPKYNLRVEKQKDIFVTTTINLTNYFVIAYTIEKESIKDEQQTKSFFRIK